MNILEAMLGAQGGSATQQLGQQFGLNENQVSSALAALVPALAAGFQQNMSSSQGLDGLISALGTGSTSATSTTPLRWRIRTRPPRGTASSATSSEARM